MPRRTTISTAIFALLTFMNVQSVVAQHPMGPGQYFPGYPYQPDIPKGVGAYGKYTDAMDSLTRTGPSMVPAAARYPQLDASLYPCPTPNVPQELGGSMITNSALYPHEMLYPHRYKALYGPFYYKTKFRYGLRWGSPGTFLGDSLPGPHFYRAKVLQKVELKGTEVDVKYNGHIHPFSMFMAPS